MSTFAQKVLEDTKHLIAQKIWCWQLANKLARTDDASTLLLPGSDYPITQPFSSMALSRRHAQRHMSSHALNMHMPWDLRGHKDIQRAKRNQGAVPLLPSPTAYGTVLKKSFHLLIAFQACRQSNSMDLFHQKLKVSCTAQISKRSAEMGWGGNIFTDTCETLQNSRGEMGWSGLWYSQGGNSEKLNSCAWIVSARTDLFHAVY